MFFITHARSDELRKFMYQAGGRYIALHLVTPAKHAAYTSPLECRCRRPQRIGRDAQPRKKERIMKSTLIKQTLGLLALGLAASGAHASWDHHDQAYARHANQQSRHFVQQIDARQDRQMDRIEAGMRQGRLTRAEYRALMHEQREIRAMERHFRADGIIDAREFRRIERALDVANSNIRDEKHDRQARNGYGHPYRVN